LNHKIKVLRNIYKDSIWETQKALHRPLVPKKLRRPLYPENWEELRYKIIVRDKFTCQKCGAKVGVDTAHVHHIQPLSKGGSNDPSNLITLCPVCHALQHPNNAGLKYLAMRWFARNNNGRLRR